MATVINKRKSAALNNESCEEQFRRNLSQTSKVPRSQEGYITQFSDKIEQRLTKKLSQEFSETRNRILGALSRHDDLLMNPQIHGHSATAPETSRNTYGMNRERMRTTDDSQSYPHPGAGTFHKQTTGKSGPENGQDTISKSFPVKAATTPKSLKTDSSEEILCSLDLFSIKNAVLIWPFVP